MPDFDLIVIGAGPGGYVAAIKGAQHGKKVALVERDNLGGICTNWGCIPTKALLKSAEVLDTLKHAGTYGLSAGNVGHDFAAVIKRSREVSATNVKGIEFLTKKNKITVIKGSAKLVKAATPTVVVTAADGEKTYTAANVIVATGARARSFPHLPVDGVKVFNYKEAMNLPAQPGSLMCIGAGAIGMEFGYFYNALGTKVTVVEVMDQVLPVEDAEVAKLVERSFTKAGVTVHTATKVTRLDTTGTGVVVHLDKAGTASTVTVDAVLVAVGMVANTQGIGLEDAGVTLDDRGFIAVNEHCQTTVAGIYAIGDVAGKQLLAHKASAEAEAAVAHMIGHPAPVDYGLIPGCTYCQPQVASVGLTEKKAKERGRPYKIGRFQFMASGKARAINHPEGFVKLIFDSEFDQLIGAHLVGYDATELLAELGLGLRLETTARELMTTVHAHPTLSEAVMEAAADALGECVHQ
jgi:dihydrolipoamide dehydrogenase